MQRASALALYRKNFHLRIFFCGHDRHHQMLLSLEHATYSIEGVLRKDRNDYSSMDALP